MGVKQLASKNERLIEYIAGLNPGEKVSVRGLAQTLGVSEGTAYKSIKAAEAQGLVMTRPKVGTVRIRVRDESDHGITLAEATGSIGAVCLCGAEQAAVLPLPPTVIGDGSVDQFRRLVQREDGRVLCLVGDRPDMHIAAVSMKAHILLTGGAQMNLRLLNRAEKMGICVYASEQDSSAVLSMLSRKMQRELPQRELTSVRDWMQLPRYIYHDDMVGEWNRVYSDIFAERCVCPVVDDSLKICGSVDAMTAMTFMGAYPSVRFSEMMEEPEKNLTVPETMTMEELAEKLMRDRRSFATVSSEGGMSGFIGMEDVVRYFQYAQSYKRFDDFGGSWLELNSEEESTQRRMFTVHTDESVGERNNSVYLRLICSAAMRHAYTLLGEMPGFDGGTFYSTTSVSGSGELFINSELMKRSANGVVLEVEMFDDKASYMKCTFALSAPAKTEDDM